jgi:hypothetical protein
LDGFKDFLIMAKPVNLYQGPAPAAMGMMGQGLLEAGANIGRITQAGYESMGKGLAGGINAAVSQYAQYKDDQAKFDATKKLFNAFESYLPKQKDPETGKEFSPMADQIRSMFDDTSMSVREKNAMAPMLLSFLGNAQQQSQALEKQQKELSAATDRTLLSENAGIMKQNAILQNQIDLENLRTRNKAFEEGSLTLPPSYGAPSAQPRSSFYNQQYR